ncbi:GTA-gp10 family protein [Maritimibacter alexandrii]|uniref:GTA-gp10 family protein n=1 Tax=Maritimibacter alexandrii TaxID=2570355 RepID=UPI001109AE53|nr:GTA-gp10 family protein [Maritimibacter alexandrii]
MTKSGMDPRAKTTFEAAGKTYTLQFTTNALVELEEATGKSVVDILESEQQSMKMLRAIFWAGLIEHHDTMTQKEAGAIIDAAGGLDAVMDLVNKAMTASMPEKGAEEKTPGKPAAAA